MNIELIIQAILALGTIIGGGIAAYATYRSTNSSVKVQEKQLNLEEARVQKELGSFGVEEAERISNISLANLQFMQQQFSECALARDALEAENKKLSIENTQWQIRVLKAVGRIKHIIERHERLNADNKIDCPAFDIINSLLREVLAELEQEV